MARPLPQVSRRWMSVALVVLIALALGFTIWKHG